MKRSRNLLFYVCSGEYGISPYRFSDLDLQSNLSEVVHKIAVAIAVMARMPVSPSQKDYSEDYDFYAWDLQRLERKTTVREVPHPGIVLAIKQRTFDLDTASAAAIVKLRVEGSEDKTQRALLESFLSGPEGNVGTKVSILFLAADPTNASRLRLGEEFREIQEKLKMAKLRRRFKLELPQLSARPADITQALLDVQPQIVHFSGHGTTTGALCFEDQVGESHLVQPDALAALFRRFANQVECVLLNACYAEKQAKAIAQHIDYVIGMSQAISDKAAIAFAVGFYQALGAGCMVEEAHELGCVQIRLQGIPEHVTPVLIKGKQV